MRVYFYFISAKSPEHMALLKLCSLSQFGKNAAIQNWFTFCAESIQSHVVFSEELTSSTFWDPSVNTGVCSYISKEPLLNIVYVNPKADLNSKKLKAFTKHF